MGTEIIPRLPPVQLEDAAVLVFLPSFLILSLRPSAVSDLGAGPEGEGLLFGLVHPEEGQPAEEPGDQPGAEERGMRQTGQQAQEGSERQMFYFLFK